MATLSAATSSRRQSVGFEDELLLPPPPPQQEGGGEHPPSHPYYPTQQQLPVEPNQSCDRTPQPQQHTPTPHALSTVPRHQQLFSTTKAEKVGRVGRTPYHPLVLPSQQAAYVRTARGLTEPKGPRRWNPILGGFVRSTHAEQDMREEIAIADQYNYQHGMDKVIKREGEYEPVFWRHRVTKEEATFVTPKRIPYPCYPQPSIADTLRHHQEPVPEATARPRNNKYNYHHADQIRALFDPNDPLASTLHDTVRVSPNRQHYKGSDHVGLLMQQKPDLEDRPARPRGVAGAQYHFTVRTPMDVCVANLISADKAAKLPMPPLFPFTSKKTHLGLVMRSGEAVREVLHPEDTTRRPSPYKTWSQQGAPQPGVRPNEMQHQFRRPQFVDPNADMRAHQAEVLAQEEGEGSIHGGYSAPSTPSSSSSFSSQLHGHPIDRTPLPPAVLTDHHHANPHAAHTPSSVSSSHEEIQQDAAFLHAEATPGFQETRGGRRLSAVSPLYMY